MKLLSVLQSGFTLMVSLPRNCPEMAQAAVAAGAQCLKVHLNCHHFASNTQFGSWSQEKSRIAEIRAICGSVPLGIVTGEAEQPSPDDLHEIAAFGLDFWDLFCRFTPPEFLQLPGLGKMVAIDSGWQPWLVESLSQLGVDVIESSIVPRDLYGSPLNLEDVARYQWLARCSPMPILIPTQKAILPQQVGALRQAGAAGITIGAVVTGTDQASFGERVQAFHEAIASLGAPGL